LATALALQKRVDEAQREITVARRLDKRSFGATYAHSILIALQGKQDRAAKLIERALRQPLDPGAPSIEDSLTNYFRRQGISPPAEAERSTPYED
jgi:Flp pilus assembly protein TadD